MRWKVTFYRPKVEQETLDLPAGKLANFLRIVQLTARKRMKEVQEQ